MWLSIMIVAGGLVAAGALLRALSWARRNRVLRTIDRSTIVREARGISLRVLSQGASVLPSMSTRSANRTVGDLVITGDRLLIVCSRGVLVDVRPDRGRPLASARTPGPGRLVLEGRTASIERAPGRFRIELVIEDAAGWVEALAPFTDPDNDGYGRQRQGMASRAV